MTHDYVRIDVSKQRSTDQLAAATVLEIRVYRTNMMQGDTLHPLHVDLHDMERHCAQVAQLSVGVVGATYTSATSRTQHNKSKLAAPHQAAATVVSIVHSRAPPVPRI